MKRGDVIIVRFPGSPAAKARPCVIVQRQSALPTAAKITVCPLTSHLRGTVGQRPFVAPVASTGLHAPSEVAVDWIFTYPIECVGKIVGHLDDPTMESVDIGIRRWLDL